MRRTAPESGQHFPVFNPGGQGVDKNGSRRAYHYREHYGRRRYCVEEKFGKAFAGQFGARGFRQEFYRRQNRLVGVKAGNHRQKGGKSENFRRAAGNPAGQKPENAYCERADERRGAYVHSAPEHKPQPQRVAYGSE